MYKFRDLTGLKFGKLKVISLDSRRKYHYYWLCECECGKTCVTAGSNLVGKKTTSCGCLRKENASKLFSTHKQTDTKLYNVWWGMKKRCYKTYNSDYHNYGGRGIKVYDEWLENFELFYEWALNNGYREGLTIDRIDVNGDYEPNNCRWVTNIEQQNNKRNNHFITYNGKTQTIAQWAREYNIEPTTLRTRAIVNKWDMEIALKKPVKRRKKNG